MILKQMLPYSKFLLELTINPGDAVVDATAGNGNDTVFLSNLVGETGTVYSFDIQQEAIENTQQMLDKHTINNVKLIHCGHQHLNNYIDQTVSAAIFNLGYLPNGNHTITTKADTTITAIQNLLPLLKVKGIIVLIIYHGHDTGKLERDALLDYLSLLDQNHVNVLKYEFINQKNNAPFILALEKRSE
ncbi:MAG: 16S rRNA (cytosine(1402)-N(4))-methyltransferase [Epulopiscium sp. Nele67-Bin001]|nr:MAG: 16S rRNA (cytosine(1402)-N(4))-methyltransferase [Epulopiscium sp. Nele67-Bin001]